MKTAHELVAAAKKNVTEVDVASAETVIAKADMLIDVREPAEYAAGRIKGSVNIPRGLLEFAIAGHKAAQSADAKLVVYCKTSGRAALAAEALQKLGYNHVTSIAGGFEAWEAAGKPVVEAGDELDFD